MGAIPVYLKTHAEMPRPKDSEFYLMTGSGLFLCRNHAFFETDAPTSRSPAGLARHTASCRARFPLIPAGVLEYAVGFSYEVYRRHTSEAIVLLLWDLRRRRYRLLVPPQQPTVWQSSNYRSPMDVTYKVPTSLPPGCLLVGDLHSHGDMGAYPSSVDRHDETYRDGLHFIVGRIEDEPPQFCAELSVDGHRFPLTMEDVAAGYRHRRSGIPASWLDQVKVIVKRPTWTYSASTYNTPDQGYYYGYSKTTPKKGNGDA